MLALRLSKQLDFEVLRLPKLQPTHSGNLFIRDSEADR